ncbi:MAG: glutamate-1-semialdehyde 2,1-aminomutase [Pseudomonadota bacterium]
MRRPKSSRGFEDAKRLMPGGVSSPVRAFGGVGGIPPFIARAAGSHIWDIDGNDYIDYVGSWGPAILGHAHPKVISALREAIELGTSFGAPTELETRLAAAIAGAFPSIEMVRFVSSGTEAAMSAIRLARGATGRPKIVKFEGCYHGHSDSLLVKAGSGAATFGVPTSAGVTDATASDTIVAKYNDIEGVASIFGKEGNRIAALIVEPVAGNMGCVPPAKGFLEALRELTRQSGALLIFDEVMTGFRVSFGSAQGLYGLEADITCLGKIVGGGLPVGAYGGPRDLMERVSPLGPVYQAGTLSGNPLAMTAGIKTIELLAAPGVYGAIEEKSAKLCGGISVALEKSDIVHRINRVGSMWSLFFTGEDVTDFLSASLSDGERFRRMFHYLLDNGVYLAPSPYESAFVSLAHTDSDIGRTIELVDIWARGETKR